MCQVTQVHLSGLWQYVRQTRFGHNVVLHVLLHIAWFYFDLKIALKKILHCDCPSDMEFLEVLTEGLNRVLLVRGGGREVITIYS